MQSKANSICQMHFTKMQISLQFKSSLHNFLFLFSDIRDAKTLVLEANLRRTEHWNIPEHSSGPCRHTAVHSAGYFRWAASVSAPRCGWQRYVGWLKWHPCWFFHYWPEPLEFVYLYAEVLPLFYRSSGGYILKIWCYSKLISVSVFSLYSYWFFFASE